MHAVERERDCVPAAGRESSSVPSMERKEGRASMPSGGRGTTSMRERGAVCTEKEGGA